jgi:hypothetical protein
VTSCSAHSRIVDASGTAGVAPATAGNNPFSLEVLFVTMGTILSGPQPSAADPQITPLTRDS